MAKTKKPSKAPTPAHAEPEVDWAEKIGKPAAESIIEMVTALDLDYERLEELRDERRDLQDAADAVAKSADPEAAEAHEALAEWDEDNGEELKELEAGAKPCGNECSNREDAERMIQEDALSVEVRSGWVSLGDSDGMTPEDFQILLATGGPAVRIMGELDDHGEPHRAWLEVQDWYKPWTQYFGIEQDTLLAYARCFLFSS